MTDQTTQETTTEKRITFEELVAHGIASGGNVVRGMPWSFSYEGYPVTHENDDLYLVAPPSGTVRFHRGEVLVTTSDGRVFTESPTPTTQETTPKYQLGRICSPGHTWAGRNAMVCNCGAWHINDEGEIAPNITTPVPTPTVEGSGRTADEEFGPEEQRVTGRGFTDFARIVDSYGGLVEVRESSSAAGPHVWVYLTGTCHLTGEITQRLADEQRGPGFMGAHLDPEQAKRLRDALDAFLADYAFSPTAARGVTGLPTWEEVKEAVENAMNAAINFDPSVEHGSAEWKEQGHEVWLASQPMKELLSTLRSAAEQGERINDAARAVLAERQRQVSVEGWTPEHDDTEHGRDALARAAAVYALPAPLRRTVHHRELSENGGRDLAWDAPEFWPFDGGFKPTPHDRRRELVKAGALILAEIERLDRRQPRQEGDR